MEKYIEVLQTLDIEHRHWDEVFTSTVGSYSGSEYLYRIHNKSEVVQKLVALGETETDAGVIIENFAKSIPYPKPVPSVMQRVKSFLQKIF